MTIPEPGFGMRRRVRSAGSILVAACTLASSACSSPPAHRASPTSPNPSASALSSPSPTAGCEGSGCATPTASPGASGPPSSRPSDDREAIVALWQGFSDSWRDGPSGAEAYIREHDYPAYQSDAGACREEFERYGVRSQEFDVDTSTITPDPDWSIPEGKAAGTRPSGRIYVMDVEVRIVTPDKTGHSTERSHVAITDTASYFFLDCARLASQDKPG